MNDWRVLLYGPAFPIEMHVDAWRRGGRGLRRRMVVARSLTAFFAVWITHRDTGHDGPGARTQRSRLANLLAYDIFLHLEHHLLPAVPVKRLGRLAARMDIAAPDIAARAGRVS